MYQCGACRYGWLWGRATRVTEHLNIGVKEQVRDGHHRWDMNRTMLQTRQRLSATNELLAKMEMDGAQDDVGHGANDAQEEGNNEEQDGRPGMVVMTHKFWSFAVHRSEVTPRLHGERATVGGRFLRQIVLDLRSCGTRARGQIGGCDWSAMLPELKHIMQACRMFLMTEKKVLQIPGPVLRTAAGGEVIMTPEQVTYLNNRFVQFLTTRGSGSHQGGNAQVYNRMEMIRENCQEKVRWSGVMERHIVLTWRC